ncbi:MAG: GTPase Era [Candidatus Competibacterales bacterium]|nr:GTPase Era [Candidatus Competibacterales bacterium]
MTRAGYVALLGRPNVGKSTLLNRLLTQKLSITSPRPQTTRHVLLGIKTLPDTQIVYVDTPGLQPVPKRALNRYMNRAATDTLGYVDAVVLLLEELRLTPQDETVLEALTGYDGPVIAAINKIDRLQDKSQLLPFIKRLSARRAFRHIVPVSALKNEQVEELERCIASLLPERPFLFAEDELTTASSRFLAAELVREKLFRRLRDEVPYALTVEVERFEDQGTLLHIGALIWVERPGQKAIVIGQGGAQLREIGRQARLDMERLFERKVFLQLWVKVRSDWSDNDQALQQFGYRDL